MRTLVKTTAQHGNQIYPGQNTLWAENKHTMTAATVEEHRCSTVAVNNLAT